MKEQKVNITVPATVNQSSLFLQYEGGENALTRAFLHVVEAGGEDILKYLNEELDLQIQFPLMDITSQRKLSTKDRNGNDRGIVYDGRITPSRFELIIESKIKRDSVSPDQLERQHNYILSQEGQAMNARLLYITPDDTCPAILTQPEYEDVAWTNWRNLITILTKYDTTSEVVNVMIEGFNGLYNELFEDLIAKEDRVLILAGRFAEPIALERGLYYCQPERKFRPSSYIAFYNDKKISHVFKITKGPIVNKGEYEGADPDGVVFELEEMKGFIETPIVNDKNKDGKPVAFTQGSPRYCTLDELRKAKTTSDLEKNKK